MFGMFFCKNTSITDTSFRIHGLFIYFPFLPKTWSSGIQLIIRSDGKILSTLLISDIVFSNFTNWIGDFELSGLIILKFGIYFTSKFNFLSKFLIITISPILYYGTSSYLLYFVYSGLPWYLGFKHINLSQFI